MPALNVTARELTQPLETAIDPCNRRLNDLRAIAAQVQPNLVPIELVPLSLQSVRPGEPLRLSELPSGAVRFLHGAADEDQPARIRILGLREEIRLVVAAIQRQDEALATAHLKALGELLDAMNDAITGARDERLRRNALRKDLFGDALGEPTDPFDDALEAVARLRDLLPLFFKAVRDADPVRVGDLVPELKELLDVTLPRWARAVWTLSHGGDDGQTRAIREAAVAGFQVVAQAKDLLLCLGSMVEVEEIVSASERLRYRTCGQREEFLSHLSPEERERLRRQEEDALKRIKLEAVKRAAELKAIEDANRVQTGGPAGGRAGGGAQAPGGFRAERREPPR